LAQPEISAGNTFSLTLVRTYLAVIDSVERPGSLRALALLSMSEELFARRSRNWKQAVPDGIQTPPRESADSAPHLVFAVLITNLQFITS
jgi:hypothetical protein